MTGKSVTWTRSTRPAAISARFIDRLPCERSGTSDSRLSRPTTSTASPRATVASGQSRGPSSVVGPTAVGMLLIRAFTGVELGRVEAAQQLHELPIGVGAEDHSLLLLV